MQNNTGCWQELSTIVTKFYIDKIKKVISDELQNMLVIYEITNQSSKTWDDYLKLLMQAYKALYLDMS